MVIYSILSRNNINPFVDSNIFIALNFYLMLYCNTTLNIKRICGYTHVKYLFLQWSIEQINCKHWKIPSMEESDDLNWNWHMIICMKHLEVETLNYSWFLSIYSSLNVLYLYNESDNKNIFPIIIRFLQWKYFHNF